MEKSQGGVMSEREGVMVYGGVDCVVLWVDRAVGFAGFVGFASGRD